jgi:NAD(P)H-quinone oxidoreductase subunit 6
MIIEIKEIIFLCVAAMTIVPCFFVAFSRNILHSAFALFFTFLGASGLYFFLDADFLALAQLIIYIGGVLVLLLFAILLTKNIDNIRRTNAISVKRAVAAGAGAAVMFGVILYAFAVSGWPFRHAETTQYLAVTTKALGSLLLTKYLLPFEAVSVMLLAVLVGSLVIAKRSVK